MPLIIYTILILKSSPIHVIFFYLSYVCGLVVAVYGFKLIIDNCCREIAKHLSLPPVKLHCSMLAEDAIKAAVKDYETKHGKSVETASATTDKAAEA